MCASLHSEANDDLRLSTANSRQRGKWGNAPTCAKLKRKRPLVFTSRSRGLMLDRVQKRRPSYLVSERPRQQSIVVSFHDNKEQGHVGPFAGPIPVQIHPQTDFVAVLRCVKS